MLPPREFVSGGRIAASIQQSRLSIAACFAFVTPSASGAECERGAAAVKGSRGSSGTSGIVTDCPELLLIRDINREEEKRRGGRFSGGMPSKEV